MSGNDWDTVLKIGSKAGGGAGGPRATTVKSKSQLNAAQRSGNIVGTEKKFGTANAASSSSGGQFLTKVDRSDDIVKPKQADPNIGKNILAWRTSKKLSMVQAAQLCGLAFADYQSAEQAKGIPVEKHLMKIEAKADIVIRGKLAGQPKPQKKPKKAKEAAPASGATASAGSATAAKKA